VGLQSPCPLLRQPTGRAALIAGTVDPHAIGGLSALCYDDAAMTDHRPATDRVRADKLAHYLMRGLNRAIREHALIGEGDRVLVAVSGGKDSLTLLDLLHRRLRYAPEHYELSAGRLRSDYHCGAVVPESWLAEWCGARGIPLVIEPLPVAEEVRNSKASACFRCSWNRRKALFLMADRLGCNVVAFGHHADDRAETALMNLLFSGQFRSMEPRVTFFGGRFVLIRPLAYVYERDIVPFASASGYPIEGRPCPSGHDSRRTLVRRLLRQLESEHRDVVPSILGALERCSVRDLPAEQEGVSGRTVAYRG